MGVALATLVVVTPGATAAKGKQRFAGTVVVAVTSAQATLPPVLTEIGPAARAMEQLFNDRRLLVDADGDALELDVRFCDNENDVELAQGCAHDAVEAGAVANLSSFDLNGASLPIYEDAGIPWFMPLAVSPDELSSPVSYVVDPTISYWGHLGEAMVAESRTGCKSTAIVRIDNPTLELLRVAWTLGLEKAGGKVVTDVKIPAALSYEPLVDQALADGATDCILMLANEDQATPFAAALAETPASGKVLLSSAVGVFTEDSVIQSGGRKSPLIGAPLYGYFPGPNEKAWADYRKVMAKYAPGTRLGTSSQNVFQAFELFRHVVAGIEGRVTAESFKAQLDETDHVPRLGGKIPPGLSFKTPKLPQVAPLSRIFGMYGWGPFEVTKRGKIRSADDAAWSDGTEYVVEAVGKLSGIA